MLLLKLSVGCVRKTNWNDTCRYIKNVRYAILLHWDIDQACENTRYVLCFMRMRGPELKLHVPNLSNYIPFDSVKHIFSHFLPSNVRFLQSQHPSEMHYTEYEKYIGLPCPFNMFKVKVDRPRPPSVFLRLGVVHFWRMFCSRKPHVWSAKYGWNRCFTLAKGM